MLLPRLFAILLLVVFAGGSYFKIFPLRGLTSPDFADFTLWQKMLDYFWHISQKKVDLLEIFFFFIKPLQFNLLQFNPFLSYTLKLF